METPAEVQLRAESFEFDREHYVNGQRNALEYFFTNGVNKSAKILDCACGDGVGLQWFKENKFTQVFGMELNPKKAEKAKQWNPNVVVGDMHDIDSFYGPASFHYIWTSHSIEHAYNPLMVLKKMHALLKDGGEIILVLPYKDTGPLDVHCGQVDLCTNQDSPDAFLKVVEECGYAISEWKLDKFREPEIWVRAFK